MLTGIACCAKDRVPQRKIRTHAKRLSTGLIASTRVGEIVRLSALVSPPHCSLHLVRLLGQVLINGIIGIWLSNCAALLRGGTPSRAAGTKRPIRPWIQDMSIQEEVRERCARIGKFRMTVKDVGDTCERV